MIKDAMNSGLALR